MIVSIAFTRPHSSAGAALCTLLRRVFVLFLYAYRCTGISGRLAGPVWPVCFQRPCIGVHFYARSLSGYGTLSIVRASTLRFLLRPSSLPLLRPLTAPPLPTTKKVRTSKGSDFSICNVRIKPCRPNPGRFRTCACRVSSARRVPGPGTCGGRTRRAGLRRSCGWLRSLPDGRPSRC